jgi:hypothetical protein
MIISFASALPERRTSTSRIDTGRDVIQRATPWIRRFRMSVLEHRGERIGGQQAIASGSLLASGASYFSALRSGT